ncbi:MAG: trypsin-like peptidase domain-containing protein [Candidatus Competibacteraceae bacterium]
MNQTEIFPLQDITEILLGRDPTANVKYDPDQDDLVSRMHARITQDPLNKTKFTITDLDSRNGTFVNNTRITGSIQIEPGDVIRFGPGGPEFQFDVEPRPENVPRATRIASALEDKFPPPTREQRPEPMASAVGGSGTPRTSVGRATVERLIAQTQGESRKTLVKGAAALLGVIALVASIFGYQSMQNKKVTEEKIETAVTAVETAVKKAAIQQQTAIEELTKNAPMSATAIVQEFGPATVFIEVAWKLIYVDTGKQIYQKTFPICEQWDEQKKTCLASKNIPAYIQLDDRTEPWLVLDDGQGKHIPIGTQHTGTGFVVANNGFILTNRHVAATWETRWLAEPGIVCPAEQVNKGKCEGAKLLQEPNTINWVPSKSVKTLTGKKVEGRIDYLYVTFPKTKLRIPARLVRVSDTADAALIKIDVPGTVQSVQLSDDNINTGETVTVLGYPVVSPKVVVQVKSQDPMNREAEVRIVPDPTVTNGLIGKVIRGEMTPVGGVTYDYFSEMGDVYQLTINATGAGNSGGPVFDSSGKVIGIFTYKRSAQDGTEITFAVPIKHGRDIMGIQRVLK